MLKRNIIYLLLILNFISFQTKSQGLLKKLGEKAANKGQDILIRKGAQEAENALNGKEKSSENRNTDLTQDNNRASNAEKKMVSYSKFDFIPGEKTLLFDDFEQDLIGEFPLKWYTNGSGEIVKIDGQNGNWLQMNSGSILSPIVKLPENFTVEFDVFLNLTANSSSVLPGFNFELFDRGEKAKRLDAYTYSLKNILIFSNTFHHDKAVSQLDSRENGKPKLKTDKIFLTGFHSYYGTSVHVAISVQRERLRLWYNSEKVMDLPIAVANPANFNQILFYGPKNASGSAAFFISHLKIATGSPDLRTKFLEQGMYVTNGILFDTGSDQIKPESFGLIKEIASAIKSSSNLKIKIVGHTDSDGPTETNLNLSIKRAKAVKDLLSKGYGISENMLIIDGKGAAEPVASNSTSTGKAENRRVEFIKIEP